ncbi:FGGY family carbohydrate kinase [Caldicellulosiruptor morganii]|uniref:FGGY family carbohydrate kinase n=1 Tax=Caldicellulosiruptor morganii TaxID=1387555 RepID=A0ABY7BRA9_9FIRM|nr:FGGY family carbohydrate kinase [Caldicellulosiruptor morganii]
MDKILTIDIGTTACKVIVFDLQGNILAKSNREYPTYTPQIEWAEQVWNDLWGECVADTELWTQPEKFRIAWVMWKGRINLQKERSRKWRKSKFCKGFTRTGLLL